MRALLVLPLAACSGPGDDCFTFSDTFRTVGNVTLGVRADDGLTSNDEGGCDVVAGSVTTALGGEVQVSADGSFVYEPPLGVGASATSTDPVTRDSFTYTLAGDEPLDGEAAIELIDVVWFIDASAQPGGVGRGSDPFVNLSAFSGVQGRGGTENPEPGDWISVRDELGRTTYDGGLVLLDRQRLVGTGVDLEVDGRVIVPAGGTPTLTHSGTVLTLASGNTVYGLELVGGEVGVLGDGIVGATLDAVSITDAEVGVRFLGTAGLLALGADVEIVDATTTGLAVNDVEGAGTFEGTLTYAGRITSDGAGGLLDLSETAPGSTLRFEGGSLTHAAVGFPFCSICLTDVAGTVSVTSPQQLTGELFTAILGFDPTGTLTFVDTTIDMVDGGFSASGVEFGDPGGATIVFEDLDVRITGDPAEVPGGVGVRVVELMGGRSSSFTIRGSSRIETIDAEDAFVALGRFDGVVQLDVTLERVDVSDSPQGSALFLSDVAGSFTVTGPTIIGEVGSVGLLVLDSTADVSLATFDLGAATGAAGRGIDVKGGAGTVTIGGGAISATTLDGVIVEDASLDMSDVSFDDIGADVVDLRGTVTLAGTGNTAADFGTLCAAGGASVTGSLDFGPLGTCP